MRDEEPGQALTAEVLAARLTVQAARLQALQEITAALALVRAPEDIAAAIMCVAARALGAGIGGVRLLSADGTQLDNLAAPSYQPIISRPLLEGPLSLPSPESTLGTPSPQVDAVRSGHPVWIETPEEGFSRYPDLAALMVPHAVLAAAALPLRVGERIIGTLSFGFSQPRAFAPDEREFLQVIADLTAQALERARLYVLEQERAEALRKSERDFRLLAEHSTDVIVRYTPDMRLLYASPAVRQLLGFEPEDIVGRYSHEFVHPDDRKAAAAARRPIQTEGEIGSAVYRCLRADGTYVWVESVGRAVRDESTGEIVEIQVTTRDISARKRAEDALRALVSEREAQATLAGALAEASAAMAMALEPERLHAIILEHLARVIPCDCAYILAYQDGWVVVAEGYGTPHVPAGFRVMPLSPVAAGLAQAGAAALLVRDTRTDARWRAAPPWVGEHEVRSALLLPLVLHGETYGTLVVASRTPDFYSQRHHHAASAFGERIVQALWNARLYRLEQERARAAEHLAALRNDFLASVSHELRTPLTAIVGIGELLHAQWDRYSEARRRERVGQIVQAANRQKQLVEDLLLVSRLEEADLALTPVTTPIATLVARAAEEVRAIYAGQVVLTEGPAALRVWSDTTRTGQVLVNLLDNAAKYSPEGSPVWVRWGQEGDLVVVRVRDQGPGIPEGGRERLFTRFGRVQGSAMRSGHVGTGLGLFISRKLAESMAGDLDLEDTGPGGSTFRLRLPVAR